MKRIVFLLITICMILTGCHVVTVTKAREETEKEWSIGISNDHASYFNRYSMERDETTCEVKGKLYQAAGDDRTVITGITVPEGGGRINITGSMDCSGGSLQLIYTAPDGTQTLLAEDTDKKIDIQLDVAEGEGSIAFAGNGESAECVFRIAVEAEAGVTFTGIMESGSVEGIEDTGFMLKEITNNWSENESILYHGDGVYANPMSTEFQVDEPITLSVSCTTQEGELKLKIVRKNISGDLGESVYFDETNPEGVYTVELDKEGMYTVSFYVKAHVGSVEIVRNDD